MTDLGPWSNHKDRPFWFEEGSELHQSMMRYTTDSELMRRRMSDLEEPMGVENIEELKPKDLTLQIEQFPDGTVQVPFVSDIGGYRIGTAIVTFLNGAMTATITLGGESAKALGIDLMFVQKSDVLSDSGPVLVAKKREG